MGAAAAVVLMKERHIVEAFERAGATSPDRGRAPDDLNVEASGIGWRRLRERAVVRETSPDSGRYYLDIEVWQGLRRTRRRAVLIVIIVAIVVLAFTVMGGHFAQTAR
jgi:hypothetical protein